MTRKISIPLGIGAHIDGGPFVAWEATEAIENGDLVLVGEHDTGERDGFRLSEIQDAVSDEMQSNEPVRLSTGMVGGDSGETVAYIRLPLTIGFVVEVNGHGAFRMWNLTGYQKRQMVERKIDLCGGEVTPA